MIKDSKVFYWVRSDFFHHNHQHRRKIEALRASGIDAELIAFVSNDDWDQFRGEYKHAKALYDTKVIRVPGRGLPQIAVRWRIRLFFVLQLLFYRKILLHSLLSDPSSLYRLRRMRLFNKRVKIVTEYEGDLPAELLYRASVQEEGGPFEEPPAEMIEEYQWVLGLQKREIENSDGLIVVSDEHRDLLSTRWGKCQKALAFPTIFDKSCSFSQERREAIRKNLKLGEATVLVHLGGAINSWHRFPDVCSLVREISDKMEDIRFLGLIRKTDLEAARAGVREAGIEKISDLLYVDSNKVPDYLSAADVALFVRHNHTMTRIVNSGKLGEYIASGLPMLSTGAHAGYHEFLECNELQLKLHEDLRISSKFLESFQLLVTKGKDPKRRALISAAAIQEFCVNQNPFLSYVKMVKDVLAGSDLRCGPNGTQIE